MPLFLKSRLLFLHIPKCGGDTITFHLRKNGDNAFLFVADGAVMVNEHTPQHMTWREFQKCGWITPSDYRIAATVRHPVDRVISDYYYTKTYRPDLVPSDMSPKTFLDEYLSYQPEVSKKYDNHNLGIIDFLSDATGLVDKDIEVYPIHEMDKLFASLGLPNLQPIDRQNVSFPTNRENPTLAFDSEDVGRICKRYQQDIDWLTSTFPNIKRDY